MLIYPIGDLDDDPEELIRFHGVSPYALHKTDHRRHRALVTINFFHLDDPERGLIHDRSRIIMGLFTALKTLRGKPTPADRKMAQSIVADAVRETSAQANCARSFKLLFESDFETAEQIANAAAEYIATKS